MRFIVYALALGLLLPDNALAFTPYGNMMMGRWAQSDRCAETATKAFPDHTPEANAKRDLAMQQCLAAARLPPRGDLQHQ